ncbi:hypothetical protein ASPFODRAFT_50437 [Aspergillus luchuensis CBS 106.47]|uniref:Uncharacterized protein n=1 Tax=Aspergillus luchuensis (strain CBS 106.47) TaxID=1137211 RepID=A0A1M3T774_ASPLC|nr:hypothetical protein ASPFODRAFT_50437 [Aspergillus luchuensis CBS 106.47]
MPRGISPSKPPGECPSNAVLLPRSLSSAQPYHVPSTRTHVTCNPRTPVLHEYLS